jgi:hypothetical protein
MFSKILLRQLYLPMAGIMFVFTWMSMNLVLPRLGITFPAVALVSTTVALWLALMAAGPLPG